MPLVLKLASCLPRRLATRVEQTVQQAQENQREWLTGDFDFRNPPDHDSDFANCFEQNVVMNMSEFYSQDFEELNKHKCIDTYAVDFVADRGTLILITNDLTTHNESLRWAGNIRQQHTMYPFRWMCGYVKYIDSDSRFFRAKNCDPNDLSVFSIPWSPPLINAITPSNITLNQDDMHTKSVYSYHGDDYDDLWTFRYLSDDYPRETDSQRYLDKPSYWKSSSWTRDTIIQTTGASCAAGTSFDPDLYTIPSITDVLPVDRF